VTISDVFGCKALGEYHVEEPKEKVEEEWEHCNWVWEKVNQTMVDL
jgi:hypothetical protein